MLTLDDLVGQGLLVCPRCASPLRVEGGVEVGGEGGGLRCTDGACPSATAGFPVVAGTPALVDFDHSVLQAERLTASAGASEVERSALARRLRRLVTPENSISPRQVARMVELLVRDAPDVGRRPRILVVGGGTVGSGLEWLYDETGVDLVSFDIYASPITQFIADGHRIPLADGAVDGVIVQAVLEHVLEPAVVAAEIGRVLRTGGVVYADTPFLQQVHEGAYDFTRFSDAGHRALFRGFERLDSGTIAGAGTALRWSIDYFVWALTRSRYAGRLFALAFFWLSHLDRALDPKASSDGASSVFFLGRKVEREVTPREIIDYYPGGG